MKIKAFGKKVSREDAYRIIFNDFVAGIVYARNTDIIESLLMGGWISLEEWTDKELEYFIDDLCIENQPKGKI